MSLFLTLTLICCLTYHPFMLTANLLLLSASLAFLSGEILSKWLFISIMMIFLGGMMILFFYLVSLSSPYKLISYNPYLTTTLFFMFGLTWMTPSMNISKSNFLAYFFTQLSSQSMIWLIFILLVSLFIVVKTTETFKGSMASTW